MDKNRIDIIATIQNNNAVSVEYGEKIYNQLLTELSKENKVLLDFKGLKLVTTAFLNAAIGQLYNTYKSEFLNDHLEIDNMSNQHHESLKRVIARAKEYFKDQKRFDKIIKESLENE